MIGAHIHEPGIASQVIDAIRVGARNVGRKKVVPVDLERLLCGKPLLASIIVVSYEHFLLGINRDNWCFRGQGFLHLGVDVTELRVAIGMIRSFVRLPIAL